MAFLAERHNFAKERAQAATQESIEYKEDSLYPVNRRTGKAGPAACTDREGSACLMQKEEEYVKVPKKGIAQGDSGSERGSSALSLRFFGTFLGEVLTI
jgi:hypothetical protein